MSSAVWAALESWSFPLVPTLLLALTTWIYLRGWRVLRRQMPERFPRWRALAFAAGLASILIAIASPLDALSSLSLAIHMTQHLLLTMVAPPLLWLGAPAIPLLRGLPAGCAKEGVGPFLAWRGLRRAAHAASHPVVAWLAFVLTMWVWHLPALYERTLQSPGLHELEHFCFLSSALLFWWPVVQPWPSEAGFPRWAMLPYLALADLQNTAFSALFTFSERVFYPSYAAAPRVFGLSPLDDQALAGALMWVPGQVAFLVPAGLLLARLLSPASASAAGPSPFHGVSQDPLLAVAPMSRKSRFDLLALPVIGDLLRRRATRRALQAILLLLAAAIVLDGLYGPAMAPMNLAGILPWTWFRGLAVLALLVAGNAFCFACPFMLPRELAKRLLPANRRWPRRLRSKLPAVLLLVAWFCAYEVFDPWDDPRATAFLVLAYFAAAFAVDGAFRGATFCKYVCPIGQFHFVTSTVSPLEVSVRKMEVCAACTTHDCIRGAPHARGCETELFLPRKAGNLDCTFCLDCARACPHDNVGLLLVAPAGDLTRDPRRSSLGRLSRRPDVAALALVLVFAAFANAAGMTAAITDLEAALAHLQFLAPRAATALWLGASLLALPALAAAVCATLAKRLGRLAAPAAEVGCRFALALVPLGVGMWAAHLLFHLATAGGAVVPASQRAALDLGLAAFGPPSWSGPQAAATAAWLDPAKLLLLDAGLCLTLWVGWRIALQYASRARRALAVLGPWAALAGALYATGVWLLLQPMEMRGAMMH